jgi:hypothetical protein
MDTRLQGTQRRAGSCQAEPHACIADHRAHATGVLGTDAHKIAAVELARRALPNSESHRHAHLSFRVSLLQLDG